MSRVLGRWQVAFLVAATVVAGAAACSKGDGGDAMAMDSSASAMQAGTAMDAGADYTIVVRSRWTKANFPFEYPEAGALTGPHFSGIIGASHNASYEVFKPGSAPTAGLERLSEEGKHSPLDEEIKGAIASGAAGTLFESGPLRDFNDSLVVTVHVDAQHPLISLVAMVAPSPDWFTGINDVNLMENGSWTASKTLDLYAWDSGGDDGLTYKAADKDNNPKKLTMQNVDRHFAKDGKASPVATVTITRK